MELKVKVEIGATKELLDTLRGLFALLPNHCPGGPMTVTATEVQTAEQAQEPAKPAEEPAKAEEPAAKAERQERHKHMRMLAVRAGETTQQRTKYYENQDNQD